jgi:hypothetical protein
LVVQGSAETGSTELRQLWEYARSRSLIFVFAPVIVLFAVEAFFESDQWTHSIDDILVVLFAAIALAILLGARKQSSPDALAHATRWATYLAAAIALAGVLGIIIEHADPADVSDDPLTVIGGIIAVVGGYMLLPGAATSVTAEYRNEWLRARTTFWFFPFFIFLGLADLNVFSLGPFAGLGLLIYAYVAAAIVLGLVGIVLFQRSQAAVDAGRLHSINNGFLVAALVLLVFAVLNFDVLSIVILVALLVNRFV